MDVSEFWQIAGLGLKDVGSGGPLIDRIELRLRTLSPADRWEFLTWVSDVDKRLRTRAHHEVGALCFGTRATADFDLLRTWWIMQGERFVDTVAENAQRAADLRNAEMAADVGESLVSAASRLCAEDGAELPDRGAKWPSVTTPLTGLAARYPRAASALERSQGPLWAAADLLRHTGRPVDSLPALAEAFRRVADGEERVVLGEWGVIDGRTRPSRPSYDRQGKPEVIPPSRFVYLRPSHAFSAALGGDQPAPEVTDRATHLLAAMLELGEPQLRVEIPNCALLRIYERDGRRLLRTRPAPDLFARALRTAHATDPGAQRRMFTPTPIGAPPRESAEDKGVVGKVLGLFGLD